MGIADPLPNKRLKLSGRSCGKNCVPSLASLFVCGSNSLRPRAVRPQLKRDPLGRKRPIRHEGARAMPPYLFCACTPDRPSGCTLKCR